MRAHTSLGSVLTLQSIKELLDLVTRQKPGHQLSHGHIEPLTTSAEFYLYVVSWLHLFLHIFTGLLRSDQPLSGPEHLHAALAASLVSGFVPFCSLSYVLT